MNEEEEEKEIWISAASMHSKNFLWIWTCSFQTMGCHCNVQAESNSRKFDAWTRVVA